MFLYTCIYVSAIVKVEGGGKPTTVSLLVCSTCLTGKCYNLHVTELAAWLHVRRKNEFWYRTDAKPKAKHAGFIYIAFIVHGDWKCFYILHVSVASMFLCKYTILGLESAKPRP